MILIKLAQIEAFAECGEAFLNVALTPAELCFLQFTAFVDGWLGFAKVLAQSVKEFAWHSFLLHSRVVVVGHCSLPISVQAACLWFECAMLQLCERHEYVLQLRLLVLSPEDSRTPRSWISSVQLPCGLPNGELLKPCVV